ncbi:DUF1572 family protein [Chryseobacterium sp. MP_3.2]|uniref:DUF1572 family protein n=1 Tax=Chryseobacterium sp. MP_3.2 TaxID=3071712 RepID=UPI002E054075|nr:hypothetical protein [Chryseobacterium sp. MP_3.2]
MKDLFVKRFLHYKELGDQTFSQINDEQILFQFNSESSSILTIVKHLSGNMISRWTNFLTEDGEKDGRNRDREFENTVQTKAEMIEIWEKGWLALFSALDQITEENLYSTLLIRREKHSLLNAILRQLAHYPYHIGQIIYIAKMLKNEDWKNLSIPENQSSEFNADFIKKQQTKVIQESSSPVCFLESNEVREEYKGL